MKHRLETKEGRELYALLKQTIEPIFGIIKEPLGLRRFGLRGLKNVRTETDFSRQQINRQENGNKTGPNTKLRTSPTEWTLVTLAYNLKRLFHMGSTPLTA